MSIREVLEENFKKGVEKAQEPKPLTPRLAAVQHIVTEPKQEPKTKRPDARMLVQEVLEAYPSARENDMDLLIRIWYLQGFKVSKEQKEAFMNCSPAETITRLRREYQASGKYPASKESQARRDFMEHAYHDTYSHTPKDYDQIMQSLFDK